MKPDKVWLSSSFGVYTSPRANSVSFTRTALLSDPAYLAEVDGWISVEDRLPESDDYYFVHIPGGKPVVATFYRSSWFANSNYGLRGVTHWMPLPSPPKEEVA